MHKNEIRLRNQTQNQEKVRLSQKWAQNLHVWGEEYQRLTSMPYCFATLISKILSLLVALFFFLLLIEVVGLLFWYKRGKEKTYWKEYIDYWVLLTYSLFIFSSFIPFVLKVSRLHLIKYCDFKTWANPIPTFYTSGPSEYPEMCSKIRCLI